jgi:ectoine hydroxylase
MKSGHTDTVDIMQVEKIRSEFNDRGYVIVREVFAPDEVQAMREACQRLETAAAASKESGWYRGAWMQFELSPLGSGDRALRFIARCGAAEPVLDDQSKNPDLLALIRNLLDGSDSAYQYLNNFHPKLPGSGVEYPWHQDSMFSFDPNPFCDVLGNGSLVSCAICVDDMTEDNGPLFFAPGSHRLGVIARSEVPANVANPQRVTADAGSVVVFHHYVLHGSFANQSAGPRRVLKNVYMHPNVYERWNHHGYPGRMIDLRNTNG